VLFVFDAETNTISLTSRVIA